MYIVKAFLLILLTSNISCSKKDSSSTDEENFNTRKPLFPNVELFIEKGSQDGAYVRIDEKKWTNPGNVTTGVNTSFVGSSEGYTLVCEYLGSSDVADRYQVRTLISPSVDDKFKVEEVELKGASLIIREHENHKLGIRLHQK